MALKIRLARGGAKKRPYYRIVVADSRAPRDGRFIEKIGAFNPLKAKDDESRLTFDAERAKYWLDKGAKPTDRVARFLSTADLVQWEHGNNPNKGKPGKKAQERLEMKRQAEEDAKAAAEEDAKAAAEEAAAAEAEKAEEPKAEEAAAEADAEVKSEDEKAE